MAHHYRSMSGLGQTPSCTPVPYVDSTGQSGTGNLCVDQSGVCGDAKALQGALQYLGYGPIDIDGKIGPQTNNALKNYAEVHGIPYPGSYAGPELCEPMVKEYAGESEPSAPAATTPTINRPAMKLASKYRMLATAPKLSTTLKPAAEPPSGQAAPPAGTQEQPAEPGFWAALPDWQKYAIIGGGVLVVGGAAYFLLMKKPKSAVANVKHPTAARTRAFRARMPKGYRVGKRYEVSLMSSDDMLLHHSYYAGAMQAITAANHLHGEVFVYDRKTGDVLIIGGHRPMHKRSEHLSKGSPLWKAYVGESVRAT